MKNKILVQVILVSILATTAIARAESPMVDIKGACKTLEAGYIRDYADAAEQVRLGILPIIAKQAEALRTLASKYSEADKMAISENLAAQNAFLANTRLLSEQRDTLVTELSRQLDGRLNDRVKQEAVQKTWSGVNCFGSTGFLVAAGSTYNTGTVDVFTGEGYKESRRKACADTIPLNGQPVTIQARGIKVETQNGQYLVTACTVDTHTAGTEVSPVRACTSIDILTGKMQGSTGSALHTDNADRFYAGLFDGGKVMSKQTSTRYPFSVPAADYIDNRFKVGAPVCLQSNTYAHGADEVRTEPKYINGPDQARKLSRDDMAGFVVAE